MAKFEVVRSSTVYGRSILVYQNCRTGKSRITVDGSQYWEGKTEDEVRIEENAIANLELQNTAVREDVQGVMEMAVEKPSKRKAAPRVKAVQKAAPKVKTAAEIIEDAAEEEIVPEKKRGRRGPQLDKDDPTIRGYERSLEGENAGGLRRIAIANNMTWRAVMRDAVAQYISLVEDGHDPRSNASRAAQKKRLEEAVLIDEGFSEDPQPLEPPGSEEDDYEPVDNSLELMEFAAGNDTGDDE